jgi:DNA-directed RNA polymerase subunit RPC12/RpoP
MVNIGTIIITDDGEAICQKCGSKNVKVIPKMFTTYYECLHCGNEERT